MHYIPEWLEIIVKIMIVAFGILAIKYIYEIIKILKND
jgi:hypothetical protein